MIATASLPSSGNRKLFKCSCWSSESAPNAGGSAQGVLTTERPEPAERLERIPAAMQLAQGRHKGTFTSSGEPFQYNENEGDGDRAADARCNLSKGHELHSVRRGQNRHVAGAALTRLAGGRQPRLGSV